MAVLLTVEARLIIMAALLLVGGGIYLFTRRGSRPAGPPVVPGSVTRTVGVPAPPFEGPARIEFSGLTKRYGTVTAIDGLTFTAEPGRITGFLGPNGAGKTTALRILLGLASPTTGTATIGGQPYRDLARPIRRVGAVLESSGAHPGRSGRDHLRVICRASGVPLDRADEVLGVVGMAEAGRRPVRSYSLGMRQRLGIAAALIGNPNVLVLDEPANGLDPEGIRWLRDLLRSLADQGRTVLVSSHLLADLQAIADDLVIIARGRLVAHGTVDSVVHSLARPDRVLVRTPEPDRLRAELGQAAIVMPASDGAMHIAGVDAIAIGEAARRAGITLHGLTIEGPDLEDVFLELTKEVAE